jgi:NTE family protein
MTDLQAGATPADEAMKALGRYALGARTMSEDAFVESFGPFLRDLPEDVWPSRPYACTAVDAESGELVLWTEKYKVGLKRAVAASCAVPGIFPCITIQGRRYMDGGVRSTINSDLAKGHDKVLVVMVVRDDAPGAIGERMTARREAEFAVLREGGAEVEMICPDEASTLAMGANLMDFRQRGPAAAAGRAQGKARATRLESFWA